MNLIEQLGLEKCKAIVDGASLYQMTGDQHSYLQECGGNHWWFNQNDNSWNKDYSDIKTMHSLADLRAAIADHSRTDYVSDIRNHIAPTTVVIEK